MSILTAITRQGSLALLLGFGATAQAADWFPLKFNSVGADGKVYLVSQDGTVSVVKAAGEWEVLAVNSLGDEVFATPAIDEGKLYIRTKGTLYCFAK